MGDADNWTGRTSVGRFAVIGIFSANPVRVGLPKSLPIVSIMQAQESKTMAAREFAMQPKIVRRHRAPVFRRCTNGSLGTSRPGTFLILVSAILTSLGCN